MSDNLVISEYLSAVLRDWQASRAAFPKNVHLEDYWPIPFFGNPATATVATVGVNPSSTEFVPIRNWHRLTQADWKRRLKHYFDQTVSPPAHEWFDPWNIGLDLLGVSDKAGSAAHFDVSYRPTRAMLTNTATVPGEFRSMVERDVKWLFRLLPLCPKLRLLLVFGPMVRANGSTESLAFFLKNQVRHFGYTVTPDGHFLESENSSARKRIHVHEVTWPGEKCVTCRVVKNIHANRGELLEHLSQASEKPLLF